MNKTAQSNARTLSTDTSSYLWWRGILAIAGFFSLSVTHAQVCPFDNGGSTLAADGLVLTRYALGARGAALVNGTAFSVSDAAVIESNIACPSCGLNLTGQVDGTGSPIFTPADATIISRKIAGMSGTQLTNGVNLGNGTRSTPAAVQSFLLAGCGTNTLPTCLTGQALTFAPSGALQCGNLPSTQNSVAGSSETGSSAIVVPSDGRPLIASLSNTAPARLMLTRCGNSSCSAANTHNAIDPNIEADPLAGVSMVIPSDGLPIISYADSVNEDLRVVKCGNPACSAGNTATAPDNGGSVGTFSSIAVGADNLPVVSYFERAGGGRLRIAKCGNVICSFAVSITIADPAVSVGAYTSIAVPPDGLPVVSYNIFSGSHPNSRGVKVLKCANTNCTGTSTITTIDTGSDRGRYTSLAIPSDGLPIISYLFAQLSGATGVKVVKCGNSACSAANVLTEVDTSTGGTLSTASIVAAADGRPLVVHGGVTLRVTKCGNAACSSGNTSGYLANNAPFSAFPSAALPPDGLPIVAFGASGSAGSYFATVKCSNSACLAP